MKLIKIYRFVAITVICVLLLATGCAEPAKETAQAKVKAPKTVTTKVEPKEQEPQEVVTTKVEPQEQKPPVKLALKFTPEDSTTYRVIIEAEKSIEWEGSPSSKPSAFKGGHTGNKVEMTFMQQVQNTDDKGNAVAKITIKEVKYLAKVKDDIVLDFDSSREKDQSSPLSKLIGQSYTVEITPSGKASKVIDVTGARAAVSGGTTEHRTAIKLLSDDVVKERHTILGLPPADKSQLSTGGKWSSFENFSFDMMGSKAYEKIYTLKEIKDMDNRRIAIAQMNAIPSAEKAKELHKEKDASFFSQMFDNTETFKGELELDLTNSKVEKNYEKLQTEWFIVDPNPENEEKPAALRMTAIRFHSIEKVD